jgi:hypothetical protein
MSLASNPQPGGPGPCMYPSDRVHQLYLQVPGSLFVAFYDSQGYGGGILPNSPPHGDSSNVGLR